MNEELNRERKKQMKEKKKIIFDEENKNKELHHKMMENNMKMLQKEKEEEKIKNKIKLANANDLKKQIVKKAEKKYQMRRDKDEERKRIQNVRFFDNFN